VGSLGCGDLTPAAQALIKINEAAEARLYAEIGTWSSAGGHCPRNETSLALQLRIPFDVSFASDSLMGASPN
jgi:hypothetical protein